MSEQIGLAVTSEPLSTENIEQMMEWTYGITPPDVYQAAQSELAAIHRLTSTDEAAEWVDLAALHDAEIKRLRAQLTEVEALCQTQSDNLQRYAASELEHNRRYADLTAKLAAANAELHELRISR